MIPSLDRLQHKIILQVTAPLPRSLRVALRYRALGSLQRAMLRRANILFIRHPKTGGTWLRVLLARLYHLKYGTSIQRVFRSDELNRQNPDLPRYLLTHGYASWERLVGEAFERNDESVQNKKVLFLARHPGDIAVSWFVQYRKRERAFRRELLEAECGETRDPRELSQWEFIQHPCLGLPAIIDYHNFWARMLSPRDNALIVRYEDLLREPVDTMRRVVRLLGEDFTEEQINDAVAFGSADNLRKLEQSSFFSNPSLRLRNTSDQDTRKVRRARAGGYREDLPPEQAQWVEQMITERLDPVLGYQETSQED